MNYNRQTSVYPGNFADNRGVGRFSISNKSNDGKFRMSVSGSYTSTKNRLPWDHTWENRRKNLKTDVDPTQTAKKYMADNKYPFRVLMDLKDPVTGKNKVVSSYQVTGIPTKFVIDKNGMIRFRLTGLPHGDDAGAEEVSAMIELAKGGNTLKAVN